VLHAQTKRHRSSVSFRWTWSPAFGRHPESADHLGELAASYPRAARSAERLIPQLKIAMVGALVRLPCYYIVIFYLCLNKLPEARNGFFEIHQTECRGIAGANSRKGGKAQSAERTTPLDPVRGIHKLDRVFAIATFEVREHFPGPVIRTYTFPGPNMTPAETWTSGHSPIRLTILA
jgi:hypothetical protein